MNKARSSTSVSTSVLLLYLLLTVAMTTTTTTHALVAFPHHQKQHRRPKPSPSLLCQTAEVNDSANLLDRREVTGSLLVMLLPSALPTAAAAATFCIVQGAEDDCLVQELTKQGGKLLDANALETIQIGSQALATIPDLAARKKWPAISSVVTGRPVVDMIQTMDSIAADDSSKQYVSQFKKDCVNIGFGIGFGAGASGKQKAILRAHTAATENLVSFVKSL